MEELLNLPTPVLALLGVLIVVQIALEVWALIVLLRTPDERLVLGKKWPWVLIILFVNTIGAIVFLAAGRTKPMIDDRAADSQPAVPTGDAATRVVDVLYGGESASGAALADTAPDTDGEPRP